MGLFSGGSGHIRTGRRTAYVRLGMGEEATAEFWEKAIAELLAAKEGQEATLGKDARFDIKKGFAQAESDARQSLQRRGLASTTTGANLSRGFASGEAGAQSQSRALREQVLGQTRGMIAQAYLGRGQQIWGEQAAYAGVATNAGSQLASASQSGLSSAMAIAGLVAAPFTGGASLGLTAGAGMGGGGGGGGGFSGGGGGGFNGWNWSVPSWLGGSGGGTQSTGPDN